MKKGFTLVELLAVIIILAVILIIAIPQVLKVIENSRSEAFTSSVKSVFRTVNYELINNKNHDLSTITIESLGLSNENYESIEIHMVNENLYIIMVGKNKFRDLVICGNYENVSIKTIEHCKGIGSALQPGNSCKHILDSDASHGNGIYWITDDAIAVYCDMTSFGGGWTQLNELLAPIESVSKGSAEWQKDTLLVGIQETACNVNIRQYNLVSPSINYSEAFMLFERVNTIGQCSSIGQTSSGWFDGPNFNGEFVTASTCNWDNGIWANLCCGAQNMEGLKKHWVFRRSGENGFSLYYNTHCAGGSGIGYQRWFVR